MRLTLTFTLGAILAGVGLVWIGQGAGLIGGSFMTGQGLWLGIGVLCLAVGVVLLARSWRGHHRQPR